MATSDLKFQVIVDPGLPPIVEGALSFETGATKDQLGPGVYNHHGPDFTPGDPGALTRLYEDLLLGTPLPLTFATHAVSGADSVLAIALFMNRDLAIIPATTGLVASVDLAHRWGGPLLAHVDPVLAAFLRSFSKFFPEGISKKERGERIGLSVQWIREYLIEGTLPNLGSALPEVRVLDIGSNSFVLAETTKPSPEAWETLFRAGHLRGVLVGAEENNLRSVIASRKHERAWPDMYQALMFLNDLEGLSGGDPEWAADGNYIRSPLVGTKILLTYLIEVFLRV